MTHPRILFFAGTDTEVGKTFVASLAVKELCHSGLRVGVYKPVASGCTVVDGRLVSADAISLWNATGRTVDFDAICPQRFSAPLAPQVAARRAGQTVDEDSLLRGLATVSIDRDIVVVEGAGGLMSPLSDNYLNSTLARKMNADVVIIAANRLGVIHQVLATVTAAGAFHLPVVGIILNQVVSDGDESVEENANIIANFTDVPILGQITHRSERSGIDWTALPAPTDASVQLIKAWL